jgi:hypothetical protein
MNFKERLYLWGLLLFISIPISAQLDFSGYFENRLFVLGDSNTPWKRFNEKFSLGDYNRLRLMMKNSPIADVTVHLAVDLFSFHGMIASPLGDSSFSAQKNKIEVLPDRLFGEIHFKGFDLTVGRQRIPLGVSYLWAPLDVFGRINVFEPKEEKPGVNAVRAYVPLGSASSLTGIISPDDHFETSSAAIRTQTRIGSVDAALTLIHQGSRELTTFGLDLRGENQLGWWVEAAISRGSSFRADKLVLGLDATLPLGTRSLYWLSEFYYDSSGSTFFEGYDFPALARGERFTLARTYLLSVLRLDAGEFLGLSVSYIGNLCDGSFILTPGMAWELNQAVSFSGGLYLPFGTRESEYNRSRMTIFYLWLKINF